MKDAIPSGAKRILERLNASGYEAFLVGGCVRDLLRGAEPQDWDVCTSARPEQVEACFDGQRVLETGLRHGTVTILEGGTGYEVTTYRVDGPYSDGRRPDRVEFVSDLTADLARRDLTINAIAMDAQGCVRDPFGGRADLSAGVIRCVGGPDRRFQEDGLRVLRAIRFASVLGFSIAPETGRAIHANRGMLAHVAAERLQSELCKLLLGKNVEEVLNEYVDVLVVFWPELAPMVGFDQKNAWHCYDVWTHTARAVASAPADPVLRLAMLLHDVGKPGCFTVDAEGTGHFYGHAAAGAELAYEMLTRLKLDHSTRKQVTELVAGHDARLSPDGKAVRRWLNRVGTERFIQLLEVKRADALAQQPERGKDRLLELDEVRRKAEEILAQRQCLSRKDLAVNGRDVIAAGAAPGPAVGAALDRLLDRVLDGALPNDRAVLLNELKNAAEDKG